MIGLGSWGKNIYRNLETFNVLKKIYDSNTEHLKNTVTSKKKIANKRKSMVGSGDRSEKIRSYNYPQGRVTDHRINLTLYKLEDIVSGIALDDVIEPLLTADLEAKIKSL